MTLAKRGRDGQVKKLVDSNRGSKFSELASRLARGPRNIIVWMRLNPLRAFKL